MTGGNILAYNNFFTNLHLPSTYSSGNIYPFYCGSTIDYKLYFNTIYNNPGITGSGNYGATGIYYSSSATSLDLRNNIINVDVTPAGTGNTVALRRSTGTTGTSPANFLASSNSNIYYAPNTTNSYLYGEGGTTGTPVNNYNLTNDPNFNTPCGLFKSFIGHEKNSFTENNLVAGTLPGTYVPTGTSYAEKGAVPTAPPVTVDYAKVTRAPIADIGALRV